MTLEQMLTGFLVVCTFVAHEVSTFAPQRSLSNFKWTKEAYRPRAVRISAIGEKRTESSPHELFEKNSSPLIPFWKQEKDEGCIEVPAKGSKEDSTMGDLVQFLDNRENRPAGASSNHASPLSLGFGAIAAVLLAVGLGATYVTGGAPADVLMNIESVFAHPQESLQGVVDSVEAMGPAGPIYFGLIYLIAEIFAVPATPLALSAGYLFGLVKGTSVVLLAATIAASVAFVVGKTFLRTWVVEVLEDNPKFKKIDKAIGKEGFKLLLLVRLSPLFPFALSNYLYGASSIDFASYFWGTLLGFTPGTIAYVYTGMVGKALSLGEGSQPWYLYAGGLGLLLAFLKLVTDVASKIVEAVEDEDETQVPL